jgi:hypothetical protein
VGSDLLLPGLIWASQTGAFLRIFVTVPDCPLFPGLISASETDAFVRIFCDRAQWSFASRTNLCFSNWCTFVRIVAVVPTRPLFPGLIWAYETDSSVRILATVCSGLLFPGLLCASGTNVFVHIFCNRVQWSVASGTNLGFRN